LIVFSLEWTHDGGSTLREPDDFRRSKREEGKLMIDSRNEIESARLRMLLAREALEDFETLKGFTSTGDHTRLTQAFNKATSTYLQLSARQR